MTHKRSLLAMVFGCSLAVAASAGAQGTIVVASFGGAMQDAQRNAFFKPFEQATGIKVIDTTGISISKMKAMQATDNVEWDVFLAAPAEFELAVKSGFLDKLDFSKLDKTVVEQMDPHMVTPYGIGSMYYGAVIAYSTKQFKGNPPRSWSDVWDTGKFPGKRILPAGTYEMAPIEPALMADGVAPDKLYPLDLDRAYRMLTKIRPNVVKWTNSGAAAPQALIDGEADIALANHARIAQLRDQGAAVDYTWDQAIVTAALWSIPKGAKNYAGALKFIEFVSRPEQQAAMAKQLPYGPVNRKAVEMLPEKVRRDSPLAPENVKKVTFLDAKSWTAPAPGGKTYVEKNLDMWNAWIRQQ